MTPELKNLHAFPSESTDVSSGWFRMLVGPLGEIGEESFDVFVSLIYPVAYDIFHSAKVELSLESLTGATLRQESEP